MRFGVRLIGAVEQRPTPEAVQELGQQAASCPATDHPGRMVSRYLSVIKSIILAFKSGLFGVRWHSVVLQRLASLEGSPIRLAPFA